MLTIATPMCNTDKIASTSEMTQEISVTGIAISGNREDTRAGTGKKKSMLPRNSRIARFK